MPEDLPSSSGHAPGTTDLAATPLSHSIAGLNLVQQRVLAALAAFDTPVPVTAVASLLEDQDLDAISHALSTLTADHLADQVRSHEYAVPQVGQRAALAYLDDTTRANLYFDAATVLSDLRNDTPADVEDLALHFAELRALLRSGEYGASYEMIEHINGILRAWNRTDLLREQREEIRGRLGDPFLDMANENALGGLYAAGDDITLASTAYGRALGIARDQHNAGAQLKILVNLAALYWGAYNTYQALGYYELVHDEATRSGNRAVQMAALEGLADCHRRHGDYQRALDFGQQALSIASLVDYPDTDRAKERATHSSVTVALKMARWHGELRQPDAAARLVEAALDTAAGRGDGQLLAACWVGRANELLDRHELLRAQSTAQQALDRAAQVQDSITMVQARATLCLIHLKTNRIGDAHREITLAWQQHRTGRSLMLLALLALVARMTGDQPAANERFQQLLTQATHRIDHDSADVAAWDYRGLALCGRVLNPSRADLDNAIAAFQHARDLTPPTPGLDAHLRFMAEHLDRRGSLRAVLALLDHRSRPA
jgi:tetratricopeptide (TPR) repeat protein